MDIVQHSNQGVSTHLLASYFIMYTYITVCLYYDSYTGNTYNGMPFILCTKKHCIHNWIFQHTLVCNILCNENFSQINSMM